MERWRENVVLCLALCTSGMLSGVVYGWPALVRMMKSEGVYEKLCNDEDDDSEDFGSKSCAKRELALGEIFAIGVFATFAARLPVGIALDLAGPRRTTTVSLLCAAVGATLFANEYYAIGFGVLTAAAPAVHVGAMHCSNLFPKIKLTVLGHFSTAFQISSFLFTIFSFFPTTLQSLFYVYALVLCLAGLLSWFIIQPPKDKYALGDRIIAFDVCHGGVCVADRAIDQAESTKEEDIIALEIEDKKMEADTTADADEAESIVVKAEPTTKKGVSALCTAILSREFIFFALHKSVVLAALQFFVLTLESRQRGSTGRAMNILYNALGAFLGIFIAGPIIGPKMDRGGAVTVFRAASLLVVSTLLLLALSVLFDFPLLADIPSYIIWSAARIAFFATFFALVVKIWGHAIFGTVVGLLSLVAAGVSISASIPLAILAFEVKSGIAYGAAVIICILICTHVLCELFLIPKINQIDASSRIVR